MRRSVIGLFLVWVFCLFWAVTPLFGWSSYGPEGVQTSCSLAWEERSWSNYSYLILYTLLCFIFPVTVIIYCYSKVLTSMNKVGSWWLLHVYYTFTHSYLHSHLFAIHHLRTQTKWLSFNGCRICFLFVAQQECRAPGWAFQPEGEWSRHQHGPGHDHSFFCLLAALHGVVSGGSCGSRALHPSTGCHHAHVLCQDQPCL